MDDISLVIACVVLRPLRKPNWQEERIANRFIKLTILVKVSFSNTFENIGKTLIGR